MAKATMTYKGVLMDVACGASGTGADGSDVVNSPGDHSKKCLVVCAPSGYGLSVMEGSAFEFYRFDNAGSDMAKKVAAATSKDRDIEVEVEPM